MYRRLTAQEAEELRASETKREKQYERAYRRTEPHHAFPDDIEKLADEIANRWFRRAVNIGGSFLELDHLFALPDPRT